MVPVSFFYWTYKDLDLSVSTVGTNLYQSYKKENEILETDVLISGRMFGQIKTVIKKREAEKDRKNRNVKLNLIIHLNVL